jgi:hypothetical protein
MSGNHLRFWIPGEGKNIIRILPPKDSHFDHLGGQWRSRDGWPIVECTKPLCPVCDGIALLNEDNLMELGRS